MAMSVFRTASFVCVFCAMNNNIFEEEAQLYPITLVFVIYRFAGVTFDHSKMLVLLSYVFYNNIMLSNVNFI